MESKADVVKVRHHLQQKASLDDLDANCKVIMELWEKVKNVSVVVN